MNENALFRIEDLKVHFPLKKRWPWSQAQYVKAVNGVSFDIHKGEILGVVGESGCGKSTLIRAIIGLVKSTSGTVVWSGRNLTAIRHQKAWQPLRKDMQMVFQDPFASLNPRITIGNIIAEPLKVYEPTLSVAERNTRVKDAMQMVGLSVKHINRYPHQFSGGQCQRVGIARALILKPSILVCDEPVSSLDVSIQAQVLNLLKSLQQKLNLTVLFIAHNLSVVRHISDRIMVMYLGKVMEMGESKKLCDAPLHPYTQALLSAVPIPDPVLERNRNIQIPEGDLPSPINPPSGCVFRTRCPIADAQCAKAQPESQKISDKHTVACIKQVL